MHGINVSVLNIQQNLNLSEIFIQTYYPFFVTLV
jgi:hypothetical protein